MLGNLQAARVHSEPLQKLSIFKDSLRPSASIWLVVDVPAGIVVGTAESWADALEFAEHYIREALTPEATA